MYILPRKKRLAQLAREEGITLQPELFRLPEEEGTRRIKMEGSLRRLCREGGAKWNKDYLLEDEAESRRRIEDETKVRRELKGTGWEYERGITVNDIKRRKKLTKLGFKPDDDPSAAEITTKENDNERQEKLKAAKKFPNQKFVLKSHWPGTNQFAPEVKNWKEEPTEEDMLGAISEEGWGGGNYYLYATKPNMLQLNSVEVEGDSSVPDILQEQFTWIQEKKDRDREAAKVSYGGHGNGGFGANRGNALGGLFSNKAIQDSMTGFLTQNPEAATMLMLSQAGVDGKMAKGLFGKDGESEYDKLMKIVMVKLIEKGLGPNEGKSDVGEIMAGLTEIVPKAIENSAEAIGRWSSRKKRNDEQQQPPPGYTPGHYQPHPSANPGMWNDWRNQANPQGAPPPLQLPPGSPSQNPLPPPPPPPTQQTQLPDANPQSPWACPDCNAPMPQGVPRCPGCNATVQWPGDQRPPPPDAPQPTPPPQEGDAPVSREDAAKFFKDVFPRLVRRVTGALKGEARCHPFRTAEAFHGLSDTLSDKEMEDLKGACSEGYHSHLAKASKYINGLNDLPRSDAPDAKGQVTEWVASVGQEDAVTAIQALSEVLIWTGNATDEQIIAASSLPSFPDVVVYLLPRVDELKSQVNILTSEKGGEWLEAMAASLASLLGVARPDQLELARILQAQTGDDTPFRAQVPPVVGEASGENLEPPEGTPPAPPGAFKPEYEEALSKEEEDALDEELGGDEDEDLPGLNEMKEAVERGDVTEGDVVSEDPTLEGAVDAVERKRANKLKNPKEKEEKGAKKK